MVVQSGWAGRWLPGRLGRSGRDVRRMCPLSGFAQGRWRPTGTAIREQPNVLSTQVGGFPAKLSISVNGWVRPAYPTNTAPWNSGVWFHRTDGGGWVSFPGVRAYPVKFDPTGLANGGRPRQPRRTAKARSSSGPIPRATAPRRFGTSCSQTTSARRSPAQAKTDSSIRSKKALTYARRASSRSTSVDWTPSWRISFRAL